MIESIDTELGDAPPEGDIAWLWFMPRPKLAYQDQVLDSGQYIIGYKCNHCQVQWREIKTYTPTLKYASGVILPGRCFSCGRYTKRW